MERYRSTIEYVAKTLASIAGIPQRTASILWRIVPKGQTELMTFSTLYQRIKDYTINELKSPDVFAKCS